MGGGSKEEQQLFKDHIARTGFGDTAPGKASWESGHGTGKLDYSAPGEISPSPNYAGRAGGFAGGSTPNYSSASMPSGIWNYGSVSDLAGGMPSRGDRHTP